MALLPNNVIRSWYDHKNGSWIYKQFCYLFQNPLWSRRLPRGFSACPMFWLALFSFFVLKPVAIVVGLGLIPLLKLVIGRPFLAFDHWLCEKFEVKAANGGMAILVVLVAFMLFFFGMGMVLLYSIYMENNPPMQTHLCGLAIFAWMIGAIVVWCYRGKCKVGVWIPVMALFTLAVLFWAIPQATWGVIAVAFSETFSVVSFLVVVLFTAICAVAKFIGVWAWRFLSYGPEGWFLPYWVLTLALAGVSSAVILWINTLLFKDEVLVDIASPTERDWKAMFGQFLMADRDIARTWRNFLIEESGGTKLLEDAALQSFASEIVANGFQVVNIADLTGDDLHNVRKALAKASHNLLDIASTVSALERICKEHGVSINRDDAAGVIFRRRWFREGIRAFDKEIEATRSSLRAAAREEALRLRRERRRQRWGAFDPLCQAVTGALAVGLKVLFAPLRFLWWVLKKTFFGAVNVVAAIWVLCKSKKQGICPYYTFDHGTGGTDGTGGTNGTVETNGADHGKN